jgi:hypothetical protein
MIMLASFSVPTVRPANAKKNLLMLLTLIMCYSLVLSDGHDSGPDLPTCDV